MDAQVFSKHVALQKAVESALVSLRHHGLLVISGPTGSGKTFLAHQLHAKVHGPNSPLISQHGAGLDEHRFESQVFGHVKGAFTGATQAYPGLVGMAERGTLCIEELEATPLEQQAKLLRLLQEKTYRRVGDLNERVFSGTFILTTREGLTDLLKGGRIREDLYYRIQHSTLTLWPLRDRTLDHGWLFDALKREVLVQLNIPHADFKQPDVDAVLKTSLPGNLHSLRSLIMQAVVKGCPLSEVPKQNSKELGMEPLPDCGSLKEDLAQCERHLIQRALRRNPFSRDQLAKALGISRRSLMYKLKEHQLSERDR